MLRNFIFWLHLSAGVITGLVVAMMAFTGVLLTYEHQILRWDDRQYFMPVVVGEKRLNIESLVESARSSGLEVTQFTFYNDERMPVLASEGRRNSTYISQYSGENLGPPGARYQGFFEKVSSWHRWFDVKGEARKTGRLFTGVSNLAFLFLLLSGAYLWLPRVFRWALIRRRLWFSGNYQNAKIRDYHWHHIFGIWSVLPLIVIVSTGVVFSFSWAENFVSKLAGNVVSAPLEKSRSEFDAQPTFKFESNEPSLDELLSLVKRIDHEWHTIVMQVPKTSSDTVEFVVDSGSGRPPTKRDSYKLSATTGTVLSASGFAQLSVERRARVFIRFLHTGEVYGIVGQSIAGLVSLTTLFLVWTGLAQAWRRLVLQPIRKRAASQLK